MKDTPAIMISSFMILFIAASCCKEYCDRSRMTLQFINYKISDVDTILLVRYQQNSQFDKPVDSFYSYTWFARGRDTILHFISPADLNKDYEIRIPAAGKIYRVSAIGKQKQHCNCGHGSTELIGSYKLNGATAQQEYVVMRN